MITPEARRPEGVSHQNGLEQSIDRYKQSDSFLALSENTRLAYTADLAQFQKYCRTQNISEIRQIESENIRNWRYQLRQAGRTPATINRKRENLSGFLNWAQVERIIPPDFTISLPKYEPVAKRQPRILSAEQVGSLISKAKNLRDASLIFIALATGATITEIVNLNAEDILRTGNGNITIRFNGSMHKVQPRTLVVDKRIGDIITEYEKANRLKPEDPLFRGYTTNRGRLRGRRLTRQAVNLILEGYASKIGIENLNPRMLQNTFIANFAGTRRELDAILGRRKPEPARSTYSPRRLLKI